MSGLSFPQMLGAIFKGDHAAFADKLTLEDPEAKTIPAEDLLSDGVLAPIMTRFAQDRPGGDPRAIASVWSKHYFSVLILPVVAVTLVFRHQLPVALKDIKVLTAENGGIRAILLPDGGKALASDDPYIAFRTMIRENLAPFITQLAQRYRVSPKVLWSNAGASLELVFREIGDRTPGLGGWEQAILGVREWPDGWPNPLYQPIRYLDIGAPKRRRERRVCCIRYLIPETPYCATCPLPQAKTGTS